LGLVLTNSIAYDSWPIPSVRVMRAGAPLLGRLPGLAIRPAIASLMLRGHDDRPMARESLRLHRAP
jgi:hypothetical protein